MKHKPRASQFYPQSGASRGGDFASLGFSKFLDEPTVALSLVVLGLIALLLAVINFVQTVYLY